MSTRNVYYGAVIQGVKDFGERAHVSRTLIDAIKSCGYEVVSEHVTARSRKEIDEILEMEMGPVPPRGHADRKSYIRDKLIEMTEGDIVAAVFEVSVPSLGTGAELEHSCLRPRMGLPEIPILALYQKDYWPNNLSTMVSGVKLPNFQLIEYIDLDGAEARIIQFLEKIESG